MLNAAGTRPPSRRYLDRLEGIRAQALQALGGTSTAWVSAPLGQGPHKVAPSQAHLAITIKQACGVLPRLCLQLYAVGCFFPLLVISSSWFLVPGLVPRGHAKLRCADMYLPGAARSPSHRGMPCDSPVSDRPQILLC